MSEQESKDEFSSFLGLIVCIETASTNHALPLYGRLQAVSPGSLTLEKKDGRLVMLKKEVVLEISVMKNQSGAI